MNYTTNYHLPQWVETDRIQMEDFNQAFSDIDQRMAEGAASAKEDDAVLADTLWAALLRGAESDLLAGRSALEDQELCHLREMRFNPLDEETLAGNRNLIHWSEERHAFLGSATLVTAGEIPTGMISYAHGSTGAAHLLTANYIFRAPGSGRLDSVTIKTYFHSTTSASSFVFAFSLEQLTGDGQWETIFTKNNIQWSTTYNDASTFDCPVAVNIPIVYGRTYRLLATFVDGENANCSFGFARYDSDYDDAPNDFVCTFTPTKDTQGSMTIPAGNSGTGSHLLAVLRYNLEPQTGGVTARVGQQEMTCLARRDAKRKDGSLCREAVFLLEHNFQPGVDLTIDMSCGADEDLCLWDVCTYLL